MDKCSLFDRPESLGLQSLLRKGRVPKGRVQGYTRSGQLGITGRNGCLLSVLFEDRCVSSTF